MNPTPGYRFPTISRERSVPRGDSDRLLDPERFMLAPENGIRCILIS